MCNEGIQNSEPIKKEPPSFYNNNNNNNNGFTAHTINQIHIVRNSIQVCADVLVS